MPCHSGGLDRLCESAWAADFYDMVDAAAVGEFKDGFRPLGFATVVDQMICTKLAGTFELVIRR